MPDPTRATLTAKDTNQSFPVHFNPGSLDYTITNTLQGGSRNRSAQYVAQSTGKLSMELVFDTTGSGEDVRIHTEKVAKLMEPGGGRPRPSGQGRPPPPVAIFQWGTYRFEGVIETYREKIDFFSSDGVPLRATVSLTMSRQDHVFDSEKNPSHTATGTLGVTGDAIAAPVTWSGPLEKTTQKMGDPAATAAIAKANGIESLRSPQTAQVLVPPGIDLAPPATFAGGGGALEAGVGFGAGASFGAAMGLDLDFEAGGPSLDAATRLAGAADALGMAGAQMTASSDLGTSSAASGSGAARGAGSGAAGGAAGSGTAARGAGSSATSRAASRAAAAAITATAAITEPLSRYRGPGARFAAKPAQTKFFLTIRETVTAPAITGSTSAGGAKDQSLTSAGVPATEGAFDALKQPRGYRRHQRLDPESLLRSTEIEGYGTGAGVGFRIGGQATMLGAASAAADVGREVRLSDRIRFDRGRGEGER